MLPSTATIIVIPFSNTQQVIKLTNSNYLFWHMQMKLYLISQGVFLFVDGSHSCPSPLDLSNHSTAASTNISSGPSQAFHMETIRSTHTQCYTLIPLHWCSSPYGGLPNFGKCLEHPRTCPCLSIQL
jgi:hypothetical protein